MVAERLQRNQQVRILIGKYKGIAIFRGGWWRGSRYWYLVDFMWKGCKRAAILAPHEFEAC